jgi:hypothetical protein
MIDHMKRTILLTASGVPDPINANPGSGSQGGSNDKSGG